MRFCLNIVQAMMELVLAPLLVVLASAARLWPKRIAIGLGPEPMINYVYHQRALAAQGYSAETYVLHTYYITDEFNVRADRWFGSSSWLPLKVLGLLRLWFYSLRTYRCVYHSFWGSPLSATLLLHRLDPLLYRLAGVKVVILPYGSDVQDLARCPNLSFKHAMSQDYPKFRFLRRRIEQQVDRWTCQADHVVSGVEWVDYQVHWDTLTLAHFSIDTEQWSPAAELQQPATSSKPQPVRVLHAPNHRAIKGTDFFVRAVEELRQEGLDVELVVAEKLSNDEIRTLMQQVDIVADQLIIGWYAMFALEAMALGKPVLCYLRGDLLEFYTREGLLQPGEMPIVNCSPSDLTAALRRLVVDAALRRDVGARSRDFVVRHHGLEVVGRRFAAINRSLGIEPDRPMPEADRTSRSSVVVPHGSTTTVPPPADSLVTR
ncbi:MAG: glycosyltransferase family 4 protein [Planctomycetia bacterium]|nr:glycosyltransferase family 4 protein [Planctomycetia bacterium]